MGNASRGTPVASQTWAMIRGAINLAGKISADMSSAPNEAIKLSHASLDASPVLVDRPRELHGPEHMGSVGHGWHPLIAEGSDLRDFI